MMSTARVIVILLVLGSSYVAQSTSNLKAQTKDSIERRRRSLIPAQGCARDSALPWGMSTRTFATLKGLLRVLFRASVEFANSFRVHSSCIRFSSQGVALGCNLLTPSA